MSFEKYEIIEQRRIEDLNSEGVVLKHKKTGAMVTLLLNDDENKVFYIGFRTTPFDSTGVAHILEHSVLCGSSKYPIKDPFIELAKGSLNTFLNAMTYPDKTVYPVASCNDKDFRNLVDVYLDAVFHPNIYKEEKIFRQEGWHYELDNVDSDLTVNGVVYNEMKGVYSSPDDVVEQEVMMSLYPDTTYGYVSGGDPEAIPELTYDAFLDFHKKYYHPSNSYIYLYGDLDAEEYLDYIDREYLSKYEYLDVNSEVELQNSFETPKVLEKEYSVLDNEDEEGTYLTYNICMGTSLDKELYVAMDVLDYVLCSAPGAILKKALIDKGIGEDVYSYVEGGIYQPYFSIIAKNADKSQQEEFVDTIEAELKRVVSDGLPRKSLMAAINNFEFRYREADYGHYPRGLMLGLKALDSWLYDKTAPFSHIEANSTYKFLKENIDKGYFEKLIVRYMIENNHKTILRVVPKEGLTAKKDEELKTKLAGIKASLGKEELSDVVKSTEALKEYQQTPDNDEDLKKIPMLTMADLKKEAVKPVYECVEDRGTQYVFHDIFTNDIEYLSLMFKLEGIPVSLLPYLGFLKVIIGLVDTKNYSYQDLFDEINIKTGGIITTSSSYVNVDNPDDISVFFNVKAKFLKDQIKEAFELIKEMMFCSDFDDSKRILEVVNETKSRIESDFVSAGHSTALGRAISYFSKSRAFDEEVNGIPFMRMIQEVSDNYDDNKDMLIGNLKQLLLYILRPENLMVDLTGDKEALKLIQDEVYDIKKMLYTEKVESKLMFPEPKKLNEGFITAGQVQYVCRAGDYRKRGLQYTGALRVLHTILGYDYLWNNIRVLGGAYGVMNGFARSGVGYIVSYRDPNLENTIEVYENAALYIKDIDLDERKTLQFVIGTLSDVDIPMTPSTKGEYSLRAFITGSSYEDIQKERDEILGVNEEIIRGLHKYLEAIMEEDCLCVVGNADKIKESEKLFMSIKELI